MSMEENREMRDRDGGIWIHYRVVFNCESLVYISIYLYADV